MTALKTVYDPEIPADIYEIGLIYRIDIADDRTVKVDMSLTSPNCPAAQELPVMVQNLVSTVAWSGKGRCQRFGTRPGTRAECRKRRASSSTRCELLSLPKITSARIRTMRQNQRMIRRDAGRTPSAWDTCR